MARKGFKAPKVLDRIFRDCSGNFAVMSAFMLTGALGTAGLVAEFGNGLFNRLEDQRTADVAAMAGATNYATNASISAMTDTVSRAATLNGIASGNAVASLVSSPSGDGNSAVKVVVSSSVPLLLSRILTAGATLPVQATAYAEVKPKSTNCILALDATANQAITISGSANVSTPNCDAVSDSNASDAFDISGSGQITTPCAITVGGINAGSGLHETVCTSADTGAASTPDPYASVPAPSPVGLTCLTVPTLPATLPSGNYCHGLTINGTATFSSGPYYVNGNFSIQGSANVTGTGVTFYVASAGTTAISGSSVAT